MSNPSWKPLQEALENAAEEFSPPLELRFKPMFGGAGVYGGAKMFASLSHAGLALKLASPDRAEALKIEGAKPLQYSDDAPVSKTYVVFPDEIVNDSAQLAKWLEKSLAFAAK